MQYSKIRFLFMEIGEGNVNIYNILAKKQVFPF